MPKPVGDWKEDDVLALPAGENDSFERKGTKILDLTVPGVSENNVLNELAKQLSAFSNTGGGQIIYGVADDGTVDNGGVALSVKGRQSTKEWLEDVIPTLTEFEILGFNVYPVTPNTGTSMIATGKALYIVDIPDSDRAPHQSKRDLKYYARLGGKSHPASHRMIEDIRNRQKHPLLDVSAIKLEIAELPPFSASMGDPQLVGPMRIRFHFQLKNVGRVMAKNTCLRLEGSPVTLTWRDYDNLTVRRRGVSTTPFVNPAFLEFVDPVYPGMEIGLYIDAATQGGLAPPRVDSPWGGPWYVEGKEISNVRLLWSLFADNAPIKHGTATLEELNFDRAADIAVKSRPDASQIRASFPMIR